MIQKCAQSAEAHKVLSFLFGVCMSAFLAAGVAFCQPSSTDETRVAQQMKELGEIVIVVGGVQGLVVGCKNVQIDAGPTRPPLEHKGRSFELILNS